MTSNLIETININADDFTDNFLTCPTCIAPYDDNEKFPKLLPCSHTLCRSCLERISTNAQPLNSLNGGASQLNQNSNVTINSNSISRSVAAADAAAAAINSPNLLNNNYSSSNLSNGAILAPYLTSNIHYQMNNLTLSNSDLFFRCPICREPVILPRGGVSTFPPSFIVNQLLDLVKNQRRDFVPLCKNHSNEELLFCETCDAAFCSLCESHCRVASNADHIVIPFSIAIKRMTEIFLFKSNQCINSFNLALANVQNEIESLNSTVETVAQSVDSSFNELRMVIERRREEVMKNLCKVKESKSKLLKEQMQLIMNEKQKVETECKEYHRSNVECRLLGAQIQKINEKLDCLRSLCEPRENSFISYEYRFNDVIENVEQSLRSFGRFRTSSTYPPLCYAIVLDENFFNDASGTDSPSTSRNSCSSMSKFNAHFNTQSNFKGNNQQNLTYSANLAIWIKIQTVDYYGQKRTEGGDPIKVIITDPLGRQKLLEIADNIEDLNNGAYKVKIVPNCIGKYRIDISVFSRPINQTPLLLNIVENIDSLWTFGGNSSSSTIAKGFSMNKGSSDRDFNMPISVRCINQLIYVLDSGNNRIKVLNNQGSFVRHINHQGLNESSSTALAYNFNKINNKICLYTLNWRLKLLSNYEIKLNSSADAESVQNYELKEVFNEPVCLMETFHPQLFIVQDKKSLNICTHTGNILYESLDLKMKNECGIKNITSFCGSTSKKTLFVADSTGIYEFSLDWLCNHQLNSLIDSNNLERVKLTELSDDELKPFTFRKFNSNNTSISSSLSSLISNASSSSSVTISTTNSQNSTTNNAKGSAVTSLCYDLNSNRLLAAKSDKQKTGIDIYNNETYNYEYSIESSQNEKPLKRVVSMSTTDDGRVIVVDLVQNLIKMYRFV